MTTNGRRDVGGITPGFIESIGARVAKGLRVRRALPGWGRVFIDRQLPYLVVYRRPIDRADAGTDRLATGSAMYVTAEADPAHRGLHDLTHRICRDLAEAFGAVVLVEVWTEEETAVNGGVPGAGESRFRIVASHSVSKSTFVETLSNELAKVRILKQSARVALDPGATPAPPGMRPLLTAKAAREIGCHRIGLGIGPIYQAPDGATEYPLVRRELQRKLGRALAQTFFDFAHTETTHRPRTYQALGRRAMVKAVWKADEQLADVGASFDLLFLVTPVNTEQAWSAFSRHRYQRPPTFAYRPLPVDPSLLKRRLHSIRIEAIEDPTIAGLFREQRRQLDRQLSLIAGRETPAFLHDSLALYGDVDDGLFALARTILDGTPAGVRNGWGKGSLDASGFAARAEQELDHYRASFPELRSTVEVRNDVSSLMVSRGVLFVGSRMRIPAKRVEALIQHEIGTHVVTHVNGSQQPLRLMASGLAGYEALQEGMGVLAEFLAGGLSPARIRLLAARVVAARGLTDGATFIDTFETLTADCGLGKRAAFMVAMRAHRGGGFAKDAVYLRGLQAVLNHLGSGGDLDTILTGKVALAHIAVVEELLRRRVLKAPVLLPRYLESEQSMERLALVRRGISIEQLIEGAAT